MRLSRSPTPSPRKSPSRSSGRPTAPAAMTSTPIASATAKIQAPNTFRGCSKASCPLTQRTAYFLADFKTKERGWVEVRYDAMQPEQIRVGRWGDVGPFKLRDVWMNFPTGGRDFRHVYDDPAALQDFLIPGYQISTHLADNAELNATAQTTAQPRYSGEQVLLFSLDSNLRRSSVIYAQGSSLECSQAW